MDRLREGSKSWSCSRCNSFKGLTLRILLRHYSTVHANEPNFQVVCDVDGCPSKFNLWNSYYRHVSRHHKHLYDENTLDDQNESGQGSGENNTQVEKRNEGDAGTITMITSEEDDSCDSRDEFEPMVDQEQV